MRTYLQERLEAQHGMPTRVLLVRALKKYQGDREWVAKVCGELKISHGTMYNWCREFGINRDKHRGLVVEE